MNDVLTSELSQKTTSGKETRQHSFKINGSQNNKTNWMKRFVPKIRLSLTGRQFFYWQFIIAIIFLVHKKCRCFECQLQIKITKTFLSNILVFRNSWPVYGSEIYSLRSLLCLAITLTDNNNIVLYIKYTLYLET